MDLVLSLDFSSLTFKPTDPKQNFDIVAAAIELKGMMKMISQQVRLNNFHNEYLNLIRDFLCREFDAKRILLCQQISLLDRLPFLLRFAPDKLLEVLDEAVREAVEQGYLEFIMLIEEEETVVQLVQAYLDRTGDIQTTAIIGLKLFSMKAITKEDLVARVFKWYSYYQSFLNKNQMYAKRARVDEKKIEIVRNIIGTSKEEQTRKSEVNLVCYHCKNPTSLTQWVPAAHPAQDEEAGQGHGHDEGPLLHHSQAVHIDLSLLHAVDALLRDLLPAAELLQSHPEDAGEVQNEHRERADAGQVRNV